ncbi:MAG: hypothetical protein ACE5J4_02490 [Candidatus Aenigmatarchaeota archaeon]
MQKLSAEKIQMIDDLKGNPKFQHHEDDGCTDSSRIVGTCVFGKPHIARITEKVGCSYVTTYKYLNPEFEKKLSEYQRLYQGERMREQCQKMWNKRKSNSLGYALSKKGRDVIDGKIDYNFKNPNNMTVLEELDEEPRNEYEIVDIFRSREIYDDSKRSRGLQLAATRRSLRSLESRGFVKMI